ncbi:hypothetical protein SKAU_G00253810 [Synaphobranchus kaupii]|uniref:Uncharacterized protein n=1 Tax=Synaphobranchus kaupii TaxID=118154 RepID=A0A9Q1F3H2_SYNKA|nr:hypothetical protein SKAU_G00253810 [Synaphobranchus kaupii]
MGADLIGELLSLCLQRIAIDESTSLEFEFIEVVKNYEVTRRRWLHADLELKKHKEVLVKSEVARTALEVKLKHARNQVDVEIKKRHKAETDYQYLERQMQLMCDILVHDTMSSACLNDEQRSMLANFNHKGGNARRHKSKRLSVIDESSFLSHSDISYDRTDDDLDLDSTVVKPRKSRVREKRRSSMGPCVGPPVLKRGRVSGRSGDLLGERPVEKEIESTIVKACVTTPESGGQIHMVIDITQETPEKTLKTYRRESLPSTAEQTSVWAPVEETNAEIFTEVEVTAAEPKVHQVWTPTVEKVLHHVFLSKTVIRPETCMPCGKRIRFGKMAVKCRDCRMVTHPECKYMCSQTCNPSAANHSTNTPMDTLEAFAPVARPRIPLLIVQCVNEIEKRGLEEKGIYRVPGGERSVKELREKYVLGKSHLMLGKVEEIHVVCGLLKDFLRKLKEPLVTFRLHRTFMDASEILDDDNSAAAMYQAVGELPQPNKDTMAFLMLHLQKVMQSPLCQMDLNNLARVFGPTIVGHGMPEPSPMTIMKDTNTQPKVIARMLSFRAEYWKKLIMMERDQVICSVVDANINNDSNGKDRDRLFKPLTSPELSSRYPPSGSRKGKLKTLGTAINSTAKCKTDPSKKRFFTSPN